MASTTVTTAAPPLPPSSPGNLHSHPPHPHRASFSAGPNPGLAPTPTPPLQQRQSSIFSLPSTASFDQPKNDMLAPNSQTSSGSQLPTQLPPTTSQQSFTMSQSQSQSQSQPQSQSQQQTSLAASSFRHFSDQAAKRNDDLPKIYTAVYSGVDVYEMEVNDVAVMRRRNDSWLNATQILKVAGVDKGKRTKILEKEIQTGEHEKVQGGYGKYQGTWIRFEKAVEVCRQYGVEDLLRPLLTYDMGQDGGVAGRGDLNTPTKEQAMAAQRKRLYNAGADRNGNGGGTFFKNISATAHSAVAAISKARFDSPGPRNRNGLARAPSFNRQSSMQSIDDFPTNSQASNYQDSFPAPDAAMSFSAGSGPQPVNSNGTEPPRKRQRVEMTPATSFGQMPNSQMSAYAETFPGSPTEPNDSFVYNQHADAANRTADQHDSYTPLPPLPYEGSPEAENKRSMLMSLFMEDGSDQSRQELLRSMSPRDLDMPIDPQSHTALHWAATLSRMALLRALVASGANPFRVNASGETALMRACIVTNSHDHNTMPELLDILGGTIEVQDNKGRTVLHHIALTSAVKGRSAASRYYLQCLLEWVVRQGASTQGQGAGSQPSVQNGQLNGGNNPPPSQSQQNPTRLGLARFMSEMLNAQDNAGDTALNIAARIGNRSIISQLLEVCASPNVANRAGLRPLDFGIGLDSAGDAVNGESGDVDKTEIPVSSQKSRESSDDIVTSITHLLTETSTSFQLEMKTKQMSLDDLHSTLRSTTAQLTEARKQLEGLQAKLKLQQLARQKVTNLYRAHDQEQYRLMQLQQTHGRRDMSASNGWEAESNTLLAAINATANGEDGANGEASESRLPSASLLRARVNAVRSQTQDTKQAVAALKGRSREVEQKYRHLVALASKCDDSEVDPHLDGLMRAVESEKGELEIGRVRRFLGGVEGVVVG
ncbi:hypothetical protein RB595_005975 [Gaeumannomyces hyphopodioides]